MDGQLVPVFASLWEERGHGRLGLVVLDEVLHVMLSRTGPGGRQLNKVGGTTIHFSVMHCTEQAHVYVVCALSAFPTPVS